jgi:hypothetical protein
MAEKSLLCTVFAALAVTGTAIGSRATAPDPCVSVSPQAVASALGLKHPPKTSEAMIPTASTCAYAGVLLTVSVGSTAITNPAPPKKVVKVSGLPNGQYMTYSGSTQSQITFFKGTAATGTYGVIRNFGKISEAKLVHFAKLLYAAVSGGATTPGGGIVPQG